ncbi:hypothetical protein GCM10023188_09600 [Pontibacter saemangeumensis]|uniref:Tetratricopeptide repeat-containing protein n=1 Tax=Pontibacter saemangeumensis TaxID=1084525 RepID=A0ABP8LCB7_9BACT
MNKSAFLELIQQASTISDQQTEELEKVAATFPYCQTAHLLLAKSAHDKGSMLSTQRLRRASAYATNRQVLKRMIYTSPAPVPAFEEPSAEPEVAIAPEAATLSTPPLPATYQEEPDESNVPEDFSGEAEATEEWPEAITGAAPEAYHLNEQPVSPAQDEAESEDRYIYKAARNPAAEDMAAPIHDPEEGTHYELAHLLTINSLSHSFTDLLARKEEPKAEDKNGKQDTQSFSVGQDDEDGEAPAKMAEPESSLTPDDSPVAEGDFSAEEETDDLATPSRVVSPEAAEIIYTPSEIDQMYAADALGYWMASSRMGESLQLKDEVTRQQPVSFHPELILEYTKTHVLKENPHEQQADSLHHQYSIIDQFLKLNPRLKTMQTLKMKQEPQEDLSLRNSKIKKGIASESLANIFLNQGKVKKAIKIYEQLLLKYPEKKSYFAEQIEKLQNLS